MEDKKTKPKPPNYWQDFKNVKNELDRVHNKLGHFPSIGDLEKLRKFSLISAIYRNYKSYPHVREILGHEASDRKPNGHWTQWENVKSELTRITREIGHFPSNS